MENERESVTETRVRLYRKALEQLREENERKEAEARSGKKPEEPGTDHADKSPQGSDKA